MTWPKSLITELASRRCIIFLGAGASVSCVGQDGITHPPKWIDFLTGLRDCIQSLSFEDESIINDLIEKEKFLDAAEIIYSLVHSADFTNFIRVTLDTPKFQSSRIHKSILYIDPKIVITTNYDKIYENYCGNSSGSASEGYNVAKYYDDHLISDLRSPIRIIIKAHGCTSDSSKVILTKSQYFNARKKYSNFYKILDSLFLSHTILFIGYSLNDPDISLLLENVNITAPSIHPHYFVTESGLMDVLKRSNKNSYNLDFIEFERGNFENLYLGLEELVDLVENERASNPAI